VPVDVDVVDPGARLCVVPWLQRLGLVHRLQTKLRTAATDLSVSSHDPQRAKHEFEVSAKPWDNIMDSVVPPARSGGRQRRRIGARHTARTGAMGAGRGALDVPADGELPPATGWL
jgi:hypothetical protein